MSEKHEICYACGFEIIERVAPPTIGTFQKVGKYTIRRQAWDDNWKEINQDTFFHEECYYKGFISAIKYGLVAAGMFDGVENVEQETSKLSKERGFPE
jgi:hypothetical protein